MTVKDKYVDKKSEDIIIMLNDFLLSRNIKIPNMERDRDEYESGNKIYVSIYGLDYELLKNKVADILSKDL